jgi:Domain of unknown function (DUF4389)
VSDSEGWQPDPSGPEDRSDEPAGAAEPPPPSAAPPPPAAPPSRSPAPAPASWPQAVSGYPIVVDIETPERIARWRPVVQWILAIPLVIVLYLLRIVAQICALIGWFAALITGELPESLGDFIAGYYRYALRTYSYVWFLRETYPPFGPALGYPDPGDDPARFDVQRERHLSRLKVLFRLILVIPQAFVLLFLGIVAYVAIVIAFFAVIITGRWPVGLRNFIAGFIRWALRVDAWFLLLADPYPPFSLT